MQKYSRKLSSCSNDEEEDFFTAHDQNVKLTESANFDILKKK